MRRDALSSITQTMMSATDSPKKFKSKSPKEKKPQGKSQNERLKIIVRRLPPSLPEGVFWQSVSDWVSEETVSWKSFHPGKVRKR
jgi:regulator of nonsense transcripts 3